MSKPVLIASAIILVIIIGALALWRQPGPAPTIQTTTPTTTKTSKSPVTSSTSLLSPASTINPSGLQTPNLTVQPPSISIVSYTDKGFQPVDLKVKAGTTVTFTNETGSPMWVASDPHPLHTGLPGFDAKKGMNKGESYNFTFTKTGKFGYHNHLATSQKGTITVE